ncbi:hypothetical protein SELMODRAFT_413537 [Selaginella moellendorffii]|uniref:CHAT domain-containing protein n=1 Tax=Selaginella moellendorffii TaxID=88036 RepID=D8RQK9_SELML|nr:hypothetical protein SELMODRAFT_413537 [Selaginella moellendorffii]
MQTLPKLTSSDALHVAKMILLNELQFNVIPGTSFSNAIGMVSTFQRQTTKSEFRILNAGKFSNHRPFPIVFVPLRKFDGKTASEVVPAVVSIIVDELEELFEHGIQVVDGEAGKAFTLRAMLMQWAGDYNAHCECLYLLYRCIQMGAATETTLYDEATMELKETLKLLIDKEGDLEEQESQIGHLLQNLTREDRDVELHGLQIYESRLWMKMAELAYAYSIKLRISPPLLLVNEFMRQAIQLAERSISPNGLYYRLHPEIRGAPQVIAANGWKLRLFEHREDQQYRMLLLDANEIKRALIWSDRSYARDMLFLVSKEGNRENSMEFDMDDDRAWSEIEEVSKIIGKETAILIVSKISTSTFDNVVIYLLHNGNLINYRHQRGFQACSPSDLLKLLDANDADSTLRDYYKIIIEPFESQLESIQPKKLVFVPSEIRSLVGFPTTRGNCGYRIFLDQVVIVFIDHGTERNNGDILQVSQLFRVCNHGIVHPTYFPDGALILAVPEDDLAKSARSSEFEECFLRSLTLTGDEVVELAGESLFRASAAVLSASRRVFAEGTLALPRSFHISGVPSVVISLLDVRDKPTLELMEKMYGNLVEGMDIASALQKAAVEMIEADDGFEIYDGTASSSYLKQPHARPSYLRNSMSAAATLSLMQRWMRSIPDSIAIPTVEVKVFEKLAA